MIINQTYMETKANYNNLHTDNKINSLKDNIKGNIKASLLKLTRVRTTALTSKLFITGGLIFLFTLCYMFFYIGSECVNYIF